MTTPTSFPKMHVSLYVSDIQKTVSFYDKFFGQPATKVKEDYAKWELAHPSLIISFVQNPARVKDNFGHLGFQVDTEAQLMERLEAARTAALPVLEEMDVNCCYARQDKFWVTDPDGFRWEIYQFHEDVAFNDPHYATESASECCTPQVQVVEKKRVRLSELSAQATTNACDPQSGCC